MGRYNNNLTEIQQDCFNYIITFIKKNDCPPIIDEIAKKFGWREKTAKWYIRRLQKKGFLLNIYTKEYWQEKLELQFKHKYPKWYRKAKVCFLCKKEKQAISFLKFPPKNKPERAICFECRTKEQRYRSYKRYELTKGQRANNAIKDKRFRLLEKQDQKFGYKYSNYGITEDDYNTLLRFQNNSCAICEKYFGGSKILLDKPMIDHNHITGKVRGILCGRCNFMIGGLDKKGDWAKLYYAIEYLKKGEE